MPKKKSRGKTFAPYVTYALADKETVDPKSGVSTPPESSVIHAKIWVDENKK